MTADADVLHRDAGRPAPVETRDPVADLSGPRRRQLPDDTLVVILSDTHIGGDPGADIFEAADELAALFDGLAAHDAPVELILVGDFFDCLAIGLVPDGSNRASLTIRRPEYAGVFGSLRGFRARDDHRVIYLPGNHDAEVAWNPAFRLTLRDAGLVDEFAWSWLAHFASAPDRPVYCEHGNQFDPPNQIMRYDDPLDTPLGHHIVTDFTRRIVPRGFITRAVDLRDLNKVYPLSAIPSWILSRVFYDLLTRAILWLFLPFLIVSFLYNSLTSSSSMFPNRRQLTEVGWDALLLLTIGLVFFLAFRRVAGRVVAALTAPLPGEQDDAWSPSDAVTTIRTLMGMDRHPPMADTVIGNEIAIFVSGHTHRPDLSEVARGDGPTAVVVNSGCWLRQLRPVPAHLGGPPVLVSQFVLTHVRITLGADGLRASLWEQPRKATPHLGLVERLAIYGRQPGLPADGAPFERAAAIIRANPRDTAT